MNLDVVTEYTTVQTERCEDAVASLVMYGPRRPVASMAHLYKGDGYWVEAFVVRRAHPSQLPEGFACVNDVVDSLRWKYLEQQMCAAFGPPPPAEFLVEGRWP